MFQIIMKLLIVLLLVVSVDLILGSVNSNTHYMDAPQRLCGSQLTAELAIQCQGWYNEDTRKNNNSSKHLIINAIVHRSKFDHKSRFNC